MKPKCPLLTVDAVVWYDRKIVLIKRKNEPFKDMFALPGGFVDVGETLEHAIIREVKEETGLDFKIREFVGVYSKPSRDPRGHVVTICYMGHGNGMIKASSDAKEVILIELEKIPKLAFDHNEIVEDVKDIFLEGRI